MLATHAIEFRFFQLKKDFLEDYKEFDGSTQLPLSWQFDSHKNDLLDEFCEEEVEEGKFMSFMKDVKHLDTLNILLFNKFFFNDLS